MKEKKYKWFLIERFTTKEKARAYWQRHYSSASYKLESHFNAYQLWVRLPTRITIS